MLYIHNIHNIDHVLFFIIDIRNNWVKNFTHYIHYTVSVYVCIKLFYKIMKLASILCQDADKSYHDTKRIYLYV